MSSLVTLYLIYWDKSSPVCFGSSRCALEFSSREWGGLRGFHWDACWLLRLQAGCYVYPVFMWVPGVQTQVLTLALQILYAWRNLPSPLTSFEYRPFSCKMGICSLREENKMRRESLHVAVSGCTSTYAENIIKMIIIFCGDWRLHNIGSFFKEKDAKQI